MRFDQYIELQEWIERLSADSTVPGGRARSRVASKLIDSAWLLLRPKAMISITQKRTFDEL